MTVIFQGRPQGISHDSNMTVLYGGSTSELTGNLVPWHASVILIHNTTVGDVNVNKQADLTGYCILCQDDIVTI